MNFLTFTIKSLIYSMILLYIAVALILVFNGDSIFTSIPLLLFILFLYIIYRFVRKRRVKIHHVKRSPTNRTLNQTFRIGSILLCILSIVLFAFDISNEEQTYLSTITFVLIFLFGTTIFYNFAKWK